MLQSLLSDLPFIRGFSRNLGESKRGTAAFVLAAFISGDPTVGSVLTATTNGASPTYQWTRDGVNIAGATASSYTLVAADEDTDIRCSVTATEGSILTNILTVEVDGDPETLPVMPSNPVILGTIAVGETVTVATVPGITGNPTPTITNFWRESGTNALLGTGNSLVLTEGPGVYVNQRATNSVGTASRISAETGPIAATPTAWAFSGDTVTEIPDAPTWAFTGDTVTTIGAV